MGVYDQAARWAAQADPQAVMPRVLAETQLPLAFQEWADSRTLSPPGDRDRTTELPREPHNAPLHLFSASPELVNFGRSAYQQRSEHASRLLRQLFESLQVEGIPMSYTMEDFERDSRNISRS